MAAFAYPGCRYPGRKIRTVVKVSGPAIHERLDAGQRVLIHCRGSLGRTRLVAGLVLVERGFDARSAIHRVRAARPHAIETAAQERFVLRWPTMEKSASQRNRDRSNVE
jgi:protein-tyrosine phosphatase